MLFQTMMGPQIVSEDYLLPDKCMVFDRNVTDCLSQLYARHVSAGGN